MKIVILGKGGCGKSTVSSLLAKGLAGRGLSVLVVDTDESNFGLHRQLGVEEPRELLDQLGGKKEMGSRMAEAKRDGGKGGMLDGHFTMDEIPPDCLSGRDGVKLLQIGKVKHFGEGCACPMGMLAREFLDKLMLKQDEVAIVDTEAGVEHVGRGVERSLPRDLENSRNSAVTLVHTACRPMSSGAVLQQPSRKKPVSGCSEHGASGSPRTLSFASNSSQP